VRHKNTPKIFSS